MDVTLLGTGDATGSPALLCDCTYCENGPRRLRPALLVETEATTVVLDVGPDLRIQLRETNTTDVDAFALTHFHQDHSDGLLDLLQAMRAGAADAWNGAGDAHAFDLLMTETAIDHLRDTFEYFLDLLEPEPPGEETVVGDLAIRPFPVEHMRPEFDTVGFVVEGPGATVAYAPDMATFVDGPPAADLDLFVCEGSALVGANHGPEDLLREAIDAADADRTVLVNANEHAAGADTGTLADRARDAGCRLGSDFDVYEV